VAEVEDGEASGGSGGLIKIILVVLLVLIVAIGSALGSLFFTGFFDAAEEDAAAQAIAELEAEIENTEALQQPEKVAKETVDEEKFKPAYHSFSAPFVANVMNSRKVLQISLAIMTYYDERVITAITTHELAITSSILDRLRMITEAEIKEPDFRRELAEELTLVINEVLEKFEEFKFAGVEEVYFTGFVVQ
jgi:flagellar FliL protein|tara:strand:+ start:9285 stop:9860 length:576 start_codon:yes stop_codon:yes gene_type:complete